MQQFTALMAVHPTPEGTEWVAAKYEAEAVAWHGDEGYADAAYNVERETYEAYRLAKEGA